MKRRLLILLVILASSFASNAQTSTEPQPIELIDNKVTFYSVQLDFESLNIDYSIESDGVAMPVVTISEDESQITIDFTDSTPGNYIISRTRSEGDVELVYSIEH